MLCEEGSGSLGAVGLATRSSDPEVGTPNPNLFAIPSQGWGWIGRAHEVREDAPERASGKGRVHAGAGACAQPKR